MAQALLNPGFEIAGATANDASLWTREDVYSYRANVGQRSGSWCGVIARVADSLIPPITYSAGYWQQVVSVTAGREYRVSIWAKQDTRQMVVPTLLVDGAEVARACDVTCWQQIAATVTASAASMTVRVELAALSGGEGALWLLDDGGVTDVAVKLSERPIDAVVSLLQANFGAKSAEIQAEIGDSLIIPVPAAAAYYKRQKPELGEQKACIEIFEDVYALRSPYVDPDAGRATFDVGLTIRYTAANAYGYTAEQMMAIGRRAAACIVRVILANSSLADSDDATQQIVVGDVIPPGASGDDSNLANRIQVTVTATVHCEEVGV